MEQSSFRL